tara:strand:- start:5 stop:331 length:327 start_codon:yes stop_codon:yes gene_type:complete
MKHLLFKITGCPFDKLNDEALIREYIKMAAQQSLSTLLEVSSHKFDPQGVTAVALLAESHISIHTWPETGTAVCDAFTCSDSGAPQAAAECLMTCLGGEDMTGELIMR